MALGWNEVKERALQFANEWKDAFNEDAKQFLIEFFDVFGISTHNELDKAVDMACRPQAFANETMRIEFLFELYDKYTAGLFVSVKKRK